MKFSCRHLLMLSGAIWMGVGIFLLQLGLRLLAEGSAHSQGQPLVSMIGGLTGVEQAAVILIAIGLVIGALKGRFVLAKTAQRTASRLTALNRPLTLGDVFTLPYLLLISVMILLGLSMRWLGLPFDIRGVVDTAVGAALLQGSIAYYRLSQSVEA